MNSKKSNLWTHCSGNPMKTCLFLILIALFGVASDAHAYIDPGYGALLWQLAVAGLVGVMFYYRNFISKLKVWFKTAFKNDHKNG